jgi:uncharacterized protein (DUF3820 family)
MDKLTDTSLMPFGKFKGLQMQDVPAKYLLWLGKGLIQEGGIRGGKKAVLNYIEDNMDVLDKEASK